MKFFLLTCLALLPLCASAANPPNILLITLDTTRADHIGCYGYKKAQTPTIDRLAAEGARFESAFSSVPITLPSHATLLTGQYPFRTGMRDNGLDRLPGSEATLANVLRSHSYHTLAFVSAAVLDRVFGLNQGFELYDDNVRVGRPEAFRYEERAASQVTAAVLDNAGKLKPPYFLWVHYYDPHVPYVPPAPYSKTFADSPYDGEIAFVDYQLGKLLQSFREHKLLDNTLIVIAGDHGESLGDHGEKTHGVFLYDSVLHVPLIVNYPGHVRPVVVSGMARLVDVFPTVLDYAGIAVPKTGTDGVSLRQAINKGETQVNEVYQESLLPVNSFGWAPLFGVRTAQWHYIDAPEKELYRVAGDMKESDNLAAKSAPQLAALQKKLAAWKQAAQAKAQPAQVSSELQESLAALGYVSSGRKAVSNGMDPKKGVPIMNQIDEAREQLAAGNYEKGRSLLEDVIKKNPENIAARTSLGTALLEHGKFSEARAQFEAALKTGGPADYVLVNLGETLAALKQPDAARKQLQAAVEVNPHYAQAYMAWAQLELDQGDTRKAAEVLDRAIRQDVKDPKLFLVRGRLAAAASDLDSAVKFFARAIEQDPDYFEAYQQSGQALYLLKRTDDSIAAYEHALQISPRDLTVTKTLGSLYMLERGDKARARALFERALELAPDAPDAADIRGIIDELSK